MWDSAGALPLSGPAAQLLAAAIAAGEEGGSFAALGRQVGLSRFAAARAGATLLEAGLLCPAQLGGYRFASEHPLAPTARQALWLLGGVGERAEPDPQDVDLLTGLVASTSEPGPTMLHVRLHLVELSGLHGRLGQPHVLAHGVYARWHTERLRDVIHRTVALGSLTYRALLLLRHHTRSTAQGERSPTAATVPTPAWVHAAHLLAAESDLLSDLVSLLDSSVTVGQQVRTARHSALDGYRQAAALKPAAASRASLLAQAEAMDEQVQQLQQRYARRLFGVGGTPAVETVGDGGDQVLAVLTRALLEDLSVQVHAMTSHPSYQAWASINPAAAAAHHRAPIPEPTTERSVLP